MSLLHVARERRSVLRFSTVTAVAGLTALVTLTACGGSGGDSPTAPPPPPPPAAVSSVALDHSTASILIGGTVLITATPTDAQGSALSGRTVTWSSNDSTIASVGSSGLVTGKGAGTTSINATSEGKRASATVTVTPAPVASVVVTPANATLLVDVIDTTGLGSTTLSASPRDANGNALTGRTITWSSSDTTVAIVSSAGLVKARAAGAATIKATSEGQTGSSAITVVRPAVSQLVITPATSTIPVGGTVSLLLIPRDAQGHDLASRFIFGTNNSPNVLTVNGLQVTGKAAGTGTVTYMSENASTTVSVTVTP